MNTTDYINNNLIEDYCLGLLTPEEMEDVAQKALLYPEIRTRIEEYQLVLTKYATEFSKPVIEAHKRKTFELFNNLITENEINIQNLPLLNKYSEKENWSPLVNKILPKTHKKSTMLYELRDENNINQFVLWTTENCPYEIHEDVYETIMLLEGKCICRIGETAHELKPGDILSIPLFEHHNLEIVEGPIIALVQRIKAA